MSLTVPPQHRYSVHAKGYTVCIAQELWLSISGVRRENWSPSLFSQETQTTENESVTPVAIEP